VGGFGGHIISFLPGGKSRRGKTIDRHFSSIFFKLYITTLQEILTGCSLDAARLKLQLGHSWILRPLRVTQVKT
jgi:hypothetical protein